MFLKKRISKFLFFQSLPQLPKTKSCLFRECISLDQIWRGLFLVGDLELHQETPESTTLPETNIAPENGWLEYYFPNGEAYFQGLC